MHKTKDDKMPYEPGGIPPTNNNSHKPVYRSGEATVYHDQKKEPFSDVPYVETEIVQNPFDSESEEEQDVKTESLTQLGTLGKLPSVRKFNSLATKSQKVVPNQ